MACCGSRRQQLGSLQRWDAPSSQPAAGWGGAPNPAPQQAPQQALQRGGTPGTTPPGADPVGVDHLGARAEGPLALLYLGTAALTLRSPLTGRLYRLEPGAPFWVERQDGALLLATGLCRPT